MQSSPTYTPRLSGELRVVDDDLFRDALPGLAPIYEESDNETQQTLRNSVIYIADDSSFSGTILSDANTDLDTQDNLLRTPSHVASVQVPDALLRTLSTTREWQPALPSSAVAQRRATAAIISSPSIHQAAIAQPARARAPTVTLGILGRDRAVKQGDWAEPTTRAKALRKTSEPLGRERPPITRSLDAAQLTPVRQVSERSNDPPTPYGSERISPMHSQHISPLQSQPPSAALTTPRRMNSTRNYFSAFTFRPNSARHSEDTEISPDISRRNTNVERRTTNDGMTGLVQAIAAPIVNAAATVTEAIRKGSLSEVYEKAKIKGLKLQRKPWVEKMFEYSVYLVLVLFVYFVLIGLPLWKGTVYWLWWVVAHKFVIAGGFSITIGLAAFYAFAPLLVLFEPDPLVPTLLPTANPAAHDVALLIPCYKSAQLIGKTLEAALKIFPPGSIFVLANGNSPVPLDNTEEMCRPYGVNHIWSPIGSKIIAQFVGCYAAKNFKYVLMIDDDCTLPPNFPIVTDRMVGKIMSIGYTIKSVGEGSTKGTLCQQAQDLEYKLSGIQRAFAGVIGSATFPHGAISIWDRKFLIKTFHQHPGFSVSEDWFFGHAARQLGSRITMCTSIFVETETPSSVFFSSGGSRGGFGEMTVFKQRFQRWNFFFVNGLWYNMDYIIRNWKLGIWEVGAKIFVFQEVYETLLYLLSPFMLPISFVVRPSFCGYLLLGTLLMYVVNVLIFNEIHLRRKNERIGWKCLWLYYLPYKVALTGVNVASCYWSLYKYARYFAKRHPKIVESEKAIEVVLRLEENEPIKKTVTKGSVAGGGRRMTVTAIKVASIGDAVVKGGSIGDAVVKVGSVGDKMAVTVE